MKNDTAVYQYLIKTLSIGEPNISDTIPIVYKTSLHTFKMSNFKNKPLNSKWTPIDKQLSKDDLERLKDFIDKIDTSSFTDHELTVKIGKHPLKKTGYETYRELMYQKSFLTFSPVIYSADKQIAICSVDQYIGFNDASQAIYLLMFRNGKWQLVKALGFGFS